MRTKNLNPRPIRQEPAAAAEWARSLAADFGAGSDAARMMRAAGLKPDPWQEEVLRSRARQVLLLCTRQAGKSTVSALLALHEALYRRGSLVLMLAPALRQSQELFRKLIGFYDALDRPVPATGESALRLELANGSRVLSLPGKEETIRGFSNVRLLVVDEASRVPDELYYTVRPMLAVSEGRLIGLSTPHGKRGWFYAEWSSAASSPPALERSEGSSSVQTPIPSAQRPTPDASPVSPSVRIRVPASRCPRISSEFLARERETMGPWWFAQEYDCEFVDTVDQVFATEWVDSIIDYDLKPLWG